MDGVDNRFSGTNMGNVVQANNVFGDVHLHHRGSGIASVDHTRLVTTLRALTFPVTVGEQPRTAVAIAPGTLATYGAEVEYLNHDGDAHVCLCRAVEPNDELWGFGFPAGDEASAEIVGLRCKAVLDEHSGSHRLRREWGELGAGSTGGPVLNWRTGAVCGLMVVTADEVWLVPVGPVAEDDRTWLALLDDEQLCAAGRRFPGVRLRTYLADVRRIGDGHPYRPMVQQGPSLTEFYLPQHLHQEADGIHRISAEALARRHEGAQVLGDPGVGKSSLVRHLAAESAAGWLTDGTGSFVPIPVPARALARAGTLPRLLAEGVTQEITSRLDDPALVDLFSHEPMPGVPWLVLVDGLDEVLSDIDRRLVLERVLNQSVYRVVVTSRPWGSDTFSRLTRGFPTYVVEPFNDEELVRFARAWFDDGGHADAEDLVEQFMMQVSRSGLDRLARVPLVSMMLCIVFVADRATGLPGTLFSVYEQFFAVLARKMESVREHFRARVAVYGSDAQNAIAGLMTALPELLTEAAVARQGVRPGERADPRPILEQVLADALPHKPQVIPESIWTELVAEALRASGLLVHRRNEFRFLHQTIEEYLAATWLARMTGPKSLLAPKTQWPWPSLEVTIFVVALWTTQAVDLTRHLTRLLGRRHRQANAGFVVELARRGVPLPADVRTLVRDVLIDRIHSHRTLIREWLEAVRWLHDLDPRCTVDELERFARDQAAEDRAAEAVREVLALDQHRGIALTLQILKAPGTSSDNRRRVAEHLVATDQQLGMSELITLLRRPGSEGAGVAWTIHAAVRKMLARDPNTTVEVLDRVWKDLTSFHSLQLELSKQLIQIAPVAAAWRLVKLAESGRGSTGLEAFRALSLLDRAACVEAMTSIAQNSGASTGARLAAATFLADDLGMGTEPLSMLAKDSGSELAVIRHLAYRVPNEVAARFLEAAEKPDRWDRHYKVLRYVADLAPDAQVPVLLTVVNAANSHVADALHAARLLADLGHRAHLRPVLERIAASAHRVATTEREYLSESDRWIAGENAQSILATIARDRTFDDDTRLAAVTAIRQLSPHTALQLYRHLSSTGATIDGKLVAAAKAAEISPDDGIIVFAALVRKYRAQTDLDLIAQAMLNIDEIKAIKEWRRLSHLVGRNKLIDDAARRHDPM